MSIQENPFSKLRKTKSKVKNQKLEGDVVTKKERGRPKKPNSRRQEIRIDATIKARLIKYDHENGGKGISSIANDAFLIFLKEKGY